VKRPGDSGAQNDRSPRAPRIERVERLGIIGDVHTERERLAAVLAHFAGMGLDRIVCTGDVPDGPLDPSAVDACCTQLQRSGVLIVSGNHDRWLQDGEMRELSGATDPGELSESSVEFLAGLPATVEFESAAGRVLLCHGLGTNDMASVQPFDHGLALANNEALQNLLAEGRYRYVISGHTHRPMVRAIGSLIVINAGTLLRDHAPCCAVADFGARRLQFYDVGDRGIVTPAAVFEL